MSTPEETLREQLEQERTARAAAERAQADAEHRAAEAAREAESHQNRADEAERRADEAETRAAGAERDVSDAEDRVRDAEQRAQDTSGGGGEAPPPGGPAAAPSTPRHRVVFWLGMILALIALLGILYATFLSERGLAILESIPSVPFARGLITYAFTIGTIAVAVMLMLIAASQSSGAHGSFTRGKEVLTVLVGIFGTIVGFYFGSPSEEGGPRPLEVGSVKASQPNPSEKASIDVSTTVNGGVPPYDVTFEFEPRFHDPVKLTVPEAGVTRFEAQLGAVTRTRAIKISVSARDATNAEATGVPTQISIRKTERPVGG